MIKDVLCKIEIFSNNYLKLRTYRHYLKCLSSMIISMQCEVNLQEKKTYNVKSLNHKFNLPEEKTRDVLCKISKF